jgi:Effector Associated Constant Component 1
MEHDSYSLTVEAADQGAAGAGALALADQLRELEGVIEAARVKPDADTMDLGTVVSVVAGSGATLALAQGLAAWLKARRGVTLKIERHAKSATLKLEVAGLDPAAAERIIETIRDC